MLSYYVWVSKSVRFLLTHPSDCSRGAVMPTPCRSTGSVPVAGSGRRRRVPLPPLPAPVTALDSGSEGPAAGAVSKLIETAVPSYFSIEVRCRQSHFHHGAWVI